MSRATGTFEVKLDPQALADRSANAMLGRLSINKQFHGDLEAVSKGEMLSAGTGVKGSAGYVAIEPGGWNLARPQRQFCAAA